MRDTAEIKRPKAKYAAQNREIGKRLRQARDDAGLTQRQVAGKLGETQSWVSKIEKGERRADLAEGRALIMVYDVDANAILFPERVVAPVGADIAADAARRERGRHGARAQARRPKFRRPSPRPAARRRRRPARRSKR